jgi:N-methylhydantoinase A
MQFIGQTHLLRVALPDGPPDRAALRAAFEAAYFARFRVELPEIRPRLVNLNLSVIGVRPGLDLRALLDPAARVTTVAEARTGTRPVWFDGWRETPVYDRAKLPLDAVIAGPAIVEQMDTTLVIEPGDRAAPDAEGNLIVTIGGAP